MHALAAMIPFASSSTLSAINDVGLVLAVLAVTIAGTVTLLVRRW